MIYSSSDEVKAAQMMLEVPVELLKEQYEQQTRARGTYFQEQFFQALMEGRVTLIPVRQGGSFRVSVTPPVQDAHPEENDQRGK